MQNLDLTSLGRSLDKEALRAKAAIEAIPEEISVEDEIRLIEAVSAATANIVEQIVALPVKTKRDAAVHAKATAWLEGTYWRFEE